MYQQSFLTCRSQALYLIGDETSHRAAEAELDKSRWRTYALHPRDSSGSR